LAYFPFFVDLAQKSGLIVGGGAVAKRKVEKLLPYGPRLTVVAPRFCPELEQMNGPTFLRREFSPENLAGMYFAVAASDDPAVNRQVSDLCRQRNILVNVVDDKAACTFLFPALVRRGSLSVGISTSGASPTGAIWLKEQISDLLPSRLEEILAWLEAQRPALKAALPEEAARAKVFSALFAACAAQNAPLDEEQLQAILKEAHV
jgi:siroheme synthase-like protein